MDDKRGWVPRFRPIKITGSLMPDEVRALQAQLAAESKKFSERTDAENKVILESADLIKELLADPRNVICVRTAVLLWNAETKLRAMVEAV